jgi:uncharacterized membrane protein YadS
MKTWYRTEDGLAVLIGLAIVGLGMLPLAGLDALGWVVKTSVWTDLSAAVSPAAKAYAGLGGHGSLFLTYLFLLLVLGVGAYFLGIDPGRFALRFTILFVLSYVCWLIGHNARLAATPNELPRYGLSWSLGLTGEAGFIVALLVGLVLGNFFPGVTAWLRDAARPEWYIKTAIVILGAALGVKATGSGELTRAILFRGLAAIIEAYLIYWALVYLVARTLFKFSREWAAPLASGISICGVSAAITTGAAIRARPVVPVMVSSLVVVFSVVELLFLPVLARAVLPDQPMVAAAWMGLAVKTDGAAVSSGAITEAFFTSRAAEAGRAFAPGWMLTTTTTVKVFIDLFIGVWAFVLAAVWAYAIERKPGQGVPVRDILARFPKFVLGYFLAFLVLLALGSSRPDTLPALRQGVGESDLFRSLFFVMTFFSIGLASNFRKLWAEGLGRLALVYIVCLFGFVIWIGLVISWLFFHGVLPPAAPSGA